MPDALTIDVLNRLLTIEYRSLPMYLRDAAPWTHPGDEQAERTLEHLVADQERMSGRLAEMVLARGGRLEIGEFPMEFTDTHFLSLDFLLKELLRHQRQDVLEIERCVLALSRDAQARALAEEVLGSERGHLDSLVELVQRSAGGSPQSAVLS